MKYEVEHYLPSMTDGFAVVGTDGTYIPWLTEAKANVFAFALNTVADERILASAGPHLRDSTATPVGCADIREYHGPVEGV